MVIPYMGFYILIYLQPTWYLKSKIVSSFGLLVFSQCTHNVEKEKGFGSTAIYDTDTSCLCLYLHLNIAYTQHWPAGDG